MAWEDAKAIGSRDRPDFIVIPTVIRLSFNVRIRYSMHHKFPTVTQGGLSGNNA